MITPESNPDNLDNPELLKIIEAEISRSGWRITFARFMELALYTPGEGYYTSRLNLLGARGDYYTSPHLSPVFGELVARQLTEFWQRCGRPTPFHLVEMGAGQGLLASDILSYLRQQAADFWPALQYLIVERSPLLQEAQRRRLQAVEGGAALLEKVAWRPLEDFEPESLTGCFFSNELVDAFPVHLLEFNGREWEEIYVSFSGGGFQENPGPLSTPALQAYFSLVGLDPGGFPPGYRTEINLQALEWLQALARSLKKGFVLTIDYGYPASSRYHPRRTGGTLQTYSRHRPGSNPYLRPGRQDITAHVDFTGLVKGGERVGLHTEGFTTQAFFLSGLGIDQSFSQLGALSTSPGNQKEMLSRYNALHRLINPAGLGGFGVLIQSKNVAPFPEPLAGLISLETIK